MRLAELTELLAVNDLEAEFRNTLARLYPICRSITSDGVRQTLAILRESIPLEIHEVPTGTPALDWVVPKADGSQFEAALGLVGQHPGDRK
jgi:aminopeptidase-like protein